MDNMEMVKKDCHVVFVAIQDDGTPQRVDEGILFAVKDDQIEVIIGTSREAVLFASIAAALDMVALFGHIPVLHEFLCEGGESPAFRQLLDISSKEKQATFQLGQMDMRESVAAMLRDRAAGSLGIIRSTLEAAAAEVEKMGVMK